MYFIFHTGTGVVRDIEFLNKKGVGGKEVNLARSAHAVLRSTIHSNIYPLFAQYVQCVHVTVDRTPPRIMLF
jgi:hypothetical protein